MFEKIKFGIIYKIKIEIIKKIFTEAKSFIRRPIVSVTSRQFKLNRKSVQFALSDYFFSKFPFSCLFVLKKNNKLICCEICIENMNLTTEIATKKLKLKKLERLNQEDYKVQN